MNICKVYPLTPVAFQWDQAMTSVNLDINERVCTSRTSLHSFKTTYGNRALSEGFRYHFSVRIVKGSNFKLGVSSTRDVLDQAFSDSLDGWAYYSNGQLRHGSKSEGPMYGETYKADDVVGVYVDLK